MQMCGPSGRIREEYSNPFYLKGKQAKIFLSTLKTFFFEFATNVIFARLVLLAH